MKASLALVTIGALAVKCPSTKARLWFHITAQKSFENVWPKLYREISETVEILRVALDDVDFGASLSGDRVKGHDDQCFGSLVDFGGDLTEKYKKLEEGLKRSSFMSTAEGWSDSLSALPYISNKHFGEENADEFRNIIVISDSIPKYSNGTTGNNCEGKKEIDWDVEEEAKCGDKDCSYKYLTEEQIFAPLRERKIGMTAWVQNHAGDYQKDEHESPVKAFKDLCSNASEYFTETSCNVAEMLSNKDVIEGVSSYPASAEEKLRAGQEVSSVVQVLTQPVETCARNPINHVAAARSMPSRTYFRNWNYCSPCSHTDELEAPEAMRCFDKSSPICDVSWTIYQPLEVICYRPVAEGTQVVYRLGGYTDNYGHKWPINSVRFRELGGGPNSHEAVRMEKFKDIRDLDIPTCTYSRGRTDLVSFDQKPYGGRQINLYNFSDAEVGSYYSVTLTEGLYGRPDMSKAECDQANNYKGKPFVMEDK